MSTTPAVPPLPVWLDCDPGHDDALAIMLAAYTPGITLLGVSTVHGNQTLAKTTLNARRVLAMAGVTGLRVAPGAAKPLLRPPRACPEIHGDSGLDGPDLSSYDAVADASQQQPAIVQMHAALREAGERATLVCTGALTNAALLLSVYPELAATVRVVFMGGAVRGGNTGAVAEFNIQLDPEAAAVVLDSGAHVTMVPLDVTHTALVTPDVLRCIRAGPDGNASNSRFRRIVGELLTYFAASYRAVFAFDSPPLHDPVRALQHFLAIACCPRRPDDDPFPPLYSARCFAP